MDKLMNKPEEVHLFQPTDDAQEDDAADEGDWTSLEYDLFEDIASALEEFVRLNHVKRFVEAEELYQKRLINHQDWFPVVAEFAEHLLLRRLYKELAEYSEKHLRAATLTDSREMQVLIMMRIIADIYLNRSFQDAIAQISIVWHHSGIDYSSKMPIDAEIHTLELLLRAAVLTERYRGPLLIKLDDLPLFCRKTEWKYFIAWSHHLFDHGYYWEAHRIFRWLLEVLPLSKTKILLKSNLEAVRQMKGRSEALETAISASIQDFMQHLEGAGSPDDSEWNGFVTRATFGHFSGNEGSPSLFESDNVVMEQLQDIIQCPLPLIYNQRIDAQSHSLFTYETIDLEQCLIDLTEASDSSRHDFDAVFRTAAEKGYVPLVKMLLFKDVLETKDLFQQRPLHLAGANGHDEIIRIMVDYGANIECEDWFRRTPIYLAAKNGHDFIVQLILDTLTGDDVKRHKFWSMALFCAVENGHEAIVRTLLTKSGANAIVFHDLLILAVRRRQWHMVPLLLDIEVGLDINAQDTWGWTPLMSAVQEGGDAPTIELLKQNGAHQTSYQPEYENEISETSMLFATKHGHDALVNMLLRQDALKTDSESDKNQSSRAKPFSEYKGTMVNAKDDNGRTALSYAAGNGMETTVKALLEHEAIEVNTEDRRGRTALSDAAANGKDKIVKVLLGVKKIKRPKDKEGQTPLSQTVLFGRGVDANAQDDFSDSALSVASQNGHEDIVNMLLESGADVNASGVYFVNALHAASTNGHKKTVKILLESGADVNGSDRFFGKALSAASKNGHKEIVKLLLERGADVNVRSGLSDYSLYVALKNGHEEIVKLLLDHGADINARSEISGYSLYVASRNGYEEIVKLLLDHGADINARSEISGYPLYVASRNGHEEIVKLLLERGADINARSEISDYPLYVASRNGHEEIVKLLLERGADVNAPSKISDCPLSVASRSGHEEIVKLLIENGADVNARSQNSDYPLCVASRNRHREIVKLLLESGAVFNVQSDWAEYPLYVASKNGHEKIVRLLLRGGVDVNINNRLYESSALYVASRNGHEEIVKLLLKSGADINVQSPYFDGAEYPVYVASKNGHEGIVKLLLDGGAKVNAKGRNSESAYDVASKFGHQSIVQLLWQYGADTSMLGKRSRIEPQAALKGERWSSR